jgi:hypothetical protein
MNALYDDAPEVPLIRLELADDIWLAELVRALNASNLTLRNIPGQPLRIVRYPTRPETL